MPDTERSVYVEPYKFSITSLWINQRVDLNRQTDSGQKISEKELEQRLIIGRTPIREAIIRLRREALIHVVPQSGTYISKISIKQIEEARFVRETLEKEVFVAACQAVTEEQLKELEKLVILQRTYAQLKDEIEFSNSTRPSISWFIKSPTKKMSGIGYKRSICL